MDKKSFFLFSAKGGFYEKKMAESISEIVNLLSQLVGDGSIPKNVRAKIRQAITTLEENKDPKIKANKALQELDDVSDDPNLPSYIRPQIWNIVSVLENL